MALDFYPIDAVPVPHLFAEPARAYAAQRVVPKSVEGAETFVRLEEKFLLPKSLVSELEQVLRERSAPSYLDDETKFNLIESVYYDSSSLNIYRNHFQTQLRRSKLRARRYAPNGAWSQKSVHLELKAKDSGVCEKERLKITAQELAQLEQGLPIPMSARLLEKSSRIDPRVLAERVARINEEIIRYQLRPFCRVVYERKAFEKDSFRVTYDDSIRFELLGEIDPSAAREIRESDFWVRAEGMVKNYRKQEFVVLELKHSGSIPEWMTSFLASRPTEKVSFSKYCYAVTQALVENGVTQA